MDAYLKEQGVPGICGVDTRRLTQIVRDHGVMNAIITKKVPENLLAELKQYRITGAVAATSAARKEERMPETSVS